MEIPSKGTHGLREVGLSMSTAVIQVPFELVHTQAVLSKSVSALARDFHDRSLMSVNVSVFPMRRAFSCVGRCYLARADKIERIKELRRARCGGPRRQDIPIDNNHAPTAMRTMPARGAIWRPKKVTFSKKMSNESRTIQSEFITPPTNNRTISAQQQPTQYAPWRSPSRRLPRTSRRKPP